MITIFDQRPNDKATRKPRMMSIRPGLRRRLGKVGAPDTFSAAMWRNWLLELFCYIRGI